jgi:hypothetical protein
MKTLTNYVSCYVLSIIEKWMTNEKFNDRLRWTERLSGIDALFFPIDDACGMKFFKYEKVAKYSYHLSRILYHFGIAPKVWDLQEHTLPNFNKVWGFMTECVHVMGHDSDMLDEDTGYDEITKQIYTVLDETPFYAEDLHEWNYGFRDDGSAVIIDFGNFGYKTINDNWHSYDKR